MTFITIIVAVVINRTKPADTSSTIVATSNLITGIIRNAIAVIIFTATIVVRFTFVIVVAGVVSEFTATL